MFVLPYILFAIVVLGVSLLWAWGIEKNKDDPGIYVEEWP